MTRPSRKFGPDEITQEQFDQLLDWLDRDREHAAARYQWIHLRLTKVFVSRGSVSPEELADRTMNRVARRLSDIRDSYIGEPAHYFLGVANNIFRESLRKDKIPAVGMPERSPLSEEEEQIRECFEDCMNKMDSGDRNLVITYYEGDKRVKIDRRRDLAARLGVGMNALRIRACRIRMDLLQCVQRCRAAAS